MSARRLVSIVMPVYKPRSDWLHAAVGAVLDQEGCTLELIVVDDGSPEPVAGLLSEFDDPRLRVLGLEHGGVSSARNAGIRAARGDFLRFVDADDVVERGSTERLVKLAGDDDTITYGSTLVCDARLRPIDIKRSHLKGWIAEDCLLYRFDVRHMSMLFPRGVVNAVGEWDADLRQCQDWDFVLRALEHAPARGEQEVAAYYRRHGASASSDREVAVYYESLVVDRYFKRHPERVGTPLEREARAKLLMVRARTALALGQGRAQQLRLVARALALHPQRTVCEIGNEVRELGKLAIAGRTKAWDD